MGEVEVRFLRVSIWKPEASEV